MIYGEREPSSVYADQEIGKFKPMTDKAPSRYRSFTVLDDGARQWMNLIVHGYDYYRIGCRIGPPAVPGVQRPSR